jgi:hypothetical protein
MSRHLAVHHFKVVSLIEALLIALLLGIILYLLQYVRSDNSSVTFTPALTSETHAETLPNATSTPRLNMQVPPAVNTTITPAFDHV